MTESTADNQPLTAEEASAFSTKLDAFSQTLADREQAILNHLLAAATAGQQDEVAGFAKSALDSFLDIQGNALRTRDLSQTALAPMTGSTQFKVKYS